MRYLLFAVLLLSFIGVFGKEDTSWRDSVLTIVKQQTDYQSKILTLQYNIDKIHKQNFNETIKLAKYGFDLSEKENDNENQGEFLRNIGGAYMRAGNLDSASVYYYKALDNLKDAKNSGKLGLVYDDLARMYRKLGQFERALYFYNKALKLYENIEDPEGIARIYNESGVVYQNIGDLRTAKKRFKKSLAIQEKREDSIGISYSLEFLGQNELLAKNFISANKYLERSLAIRKMLKDKFSIMLSYTSLGDFYKETKDYNLSNEYFEKSNNLAREINFLDIQQYNFSQMEDNFEKLGNYKGAYINLKRFNELNDSLFAIEKIKAVEEISAKYETIEKERKILEQRTKIAEGELKLQTSLLYLYGLAALVIFILLFIYFFFSRQKLKHIEFKREAELKEIELKLEATEKVQKERLRISRDLHDNIGSRLAFIISALDNLIFGLKREKQPEKQSIETIKEFSNETIDELRDTIWAMNQTSITMQDLKLRIINFIKNAKQFHEKIDIRLNFDKQLSQDFNFSNLTGLNIYRIVQEATNNALKYSKSHQICVDFEKKDNFLIFTIADSGIGFNKNEIVLGNGLLNMKKRTLELSGQLKITSDKEKGTTIKLFVPIV